MPTNWNRSKQHQTTVFGHAWAQALSDVVAHVKHAVLAVCIHVCMLFVTVYGT